MVASTFRKVLSVVLIWNLITLPLVGANPPAPPRGAAKWVVPTGDFSFAPPEPSAAPKAASPARSAVTPAAPAGSHAPVARAISRLRPAAMMMQASSISVSVAYADSSSANASFPTPWQGSPNVVFMGTGTPINAGAIRIDNPGPTPLTIDSVAVDLQRPTAQFNLWGSFIIPAGGSAILTQTQAGNFDTSAFPIVACGGTLAANETRIPNITVTIGGTPQTFVDSAHVLDTGGFDLSCRGNESLQWRQAGTTGIANLSGHLGLSPATSTGTGGSPLTTTAQLADASGSPLANVAIDFDILTGPNAGQTGQGVTDSNGNATFTYTSSTQGADVVQASVTNASQGEVESNQVTVNWQTASCGATGAQSGTASLTYIGTTEGEFNDSAELAALLTDGTGTPASGRSVTFTLGGQNFTAVTDSTGVARAATVLSSAPGQVPVNVAFPGDATLPALEGSGTITVDRDETQIRYTGTTLLGNSAPQPVTAVLLDPQSLAPIPNETVTFTVNSVTATATTNANGVAATTISLGTTQPTGPSQLTVKFAGDGFYKPSVRTIPVTIFFPAGFVVWGGNTGGLKIGQQVNFWGAQWEQQVINGQYFAANPSFKGWSGSLAPIQPCEVNATPSTVDMNCWQVKPGNSFPPNETLPNFIEVVVSTVIVKSGSTVFGNIACGAIVQVNHTPPYGGVPGQPGFGTIAAVDGSCAGVFPPPAVITATQTQPATVLPNQQITISTTVNNTSTATAATSVTVSETLDGLTPGTATLNLGTVQPNGNQSGTFQATVPGIPGRQSAESSTDYIQRLSALDGRIFTASGQVTFTDATQQNYLPVNVSSQSVLKIPILSLALTGPAVVTPGSAATYFVTATNIGSAAASSVTINVTLPDGSTASFPVSTIVPGSSFSQPVNFTPAALAAKGTNETTDQYLARLAAADGQILTISSTVNWADANGNAYGDVGQQMFSSRVRVPILSFTGQAPATLLPTQNATLNFTVNNTGGCTAVLSNLQVTNPDNSTASAQQFPLAAGQSITEQTSWRVTAVAPKSATETDAAYLARLSGINNSTLSFLANLNWSDPEGGNYGPTSETVQSKEIVPIVSVALTAPSTAQAGSSIAYGLTVTNTGGATSPGITLTLTLPDGSMQTPAVPALAPGGSFQATVNFAIPSTQAAGVISAQAVVLWNDTIGNGYGPVSATAQTTVTNPQQFNSLVLAPAIAGPDVTGTSQTLTATLKDSSSNPIANATVQFTVTGANPGSASATTNASGVATFIYTGTHSGNDTVQATSGTAVSNNATVSWVTPVQNISTATIFARFFTSDGSGSFDTPPTATPAFTQSFPTINFNPPAGTIPGNTSGIGVNTRPFFDVTTDLNGNFTGTIEAKGNGVEAGLNTMFTFQAVFTSSFTVANAGDVVLSFFSDDGFVLGIGGGATRVSGPLVNVPPGGVTAFTQLPVVGAFNTATAPTANTIVVHFSAAGTYPYELDYTECCGGQESLTMAVGQANSKGVPPTGSLTLSPNNPPTLAVGQTQTFSVQAFDASGAAVPNAGVAIIINGANMQQLTTTTDATGHGTFSYKATNAGTDSIQCVANISGLGAFSNLVNVAWSVPAGGGGGGGVTTVAQQGWIGAPLIGTTLEGQIPITVASGISLTSGTLEYWPSNNPSDIHVINPNTTGSGTIGTFDGTTLANGAYVIQLQATANGTQQTSLILVNVTGDNKPGRFTKTVTDVRVPVAGLKINVSRTYDSLKRGQVEDFGFGWALTIGVDLQVSPNNDVTFTFNGRRVTFKFVPQPSPFPFPFLLTPKYFPQTGVFGTLTSDGCGIMVAPQGNLVCFPGIDVYNPTTYTYTDPYGRVYVFGSDGTMKSVQDLNGNQLVFGPNGITSTGTGVTIPFVRDSQNRITQVTDANGNSFIYSYDASGNLVNVLIPNSPTPVTYGYTTDHLLNKEVDPRGGTSSSVYGTDGRLQSVTDQLGNVTQYSYDLVHNTITTTNPDGGQTVRTNDAVGNMISYKDPLGRVTTYTYDTHQNLLTRTNGLGKTTTFTYDANGNVTSIKDPLGHTVTKVYDNTGRLQQMTDALGQVTQLQHDPHGNLTGITDAIGVLAGRTVDGKGNITSFTAPSGATAQFTYDNFGNPTGVTDHLGFASTRSYDSMGHWTGMTDSQHGSMTFQFDNVGHMTLRQDPLGDQLSTSYDNVGNRSGEVDPNGNTYAYSFDAANNQIQKTYPDGTTYKQTYDYAGRVLTATNQSGQVTRRTYDKAGELMNVTFGDGTTDTATISYSYDAAGRLTQLTDGRGNKSSVAYDDADRITSMTDALGRVTNLVYDADGRVTSVTKPGGAKTQFAYDVRNRPTSVTNPDGTSRQIVFDGLTLHSKTDEAGKTTNYTYNGLAEISSVTDALGNKTQYGYDAVGNLNSVTDANGHVTSYQYDKADRRTKKILPDGSFEQYTYDANSNITAIRLTDGHVNQYTYDNMDRITQINYFDGQVVTFTYTATGKRKTATTSAGTWQYAYDNTDRLIKMTQPDLTAISYTYDAMNNVTSITTPAGVARYTYDVLNRLATVTDPSGGVTNFAYDTTGRLSQKSLPNGVLTKYAYDSLDRLTGVTHQQGTTAPFESFQYTFGPSGKRLNVVEKDGTQTSWTYDDGYRLLSETVASGANSSTTSYTYDGVGNRLTMTSGGTTTNYSYNQLDQLTGAGTAQYSYDGRGNLTTITDTPGVTSYGYDGANRLASVSLPGVGQVATYGYDADGFLASRTQGPAVRRYAWDKIGDYGDVLYETVNGAVQANYTLAQGNLLQQITQSNNPAASYFLHDGLGSVIGLTSPTGTETDRYRFDAYGVQRSSTGASINPYRYRSQRTEDISSLLYLRARYFSTGIGRFITRDVSEFKLGDPVDLNRYNYAASNPINDYDPTGNQDAVEYGLQAERSEENATIEGYIVGREDESLISCAGDVLVSVLDQAVGVLGGIWEHLPNKITVAAGHVVENPLDIKYGTDQELLAEMQNDVARKKLLAKAAEFEASPRENILAISGRYVPKEFREQVGNWEVVFFADNGANATGPTADKCQNHAERKVLSISGAPYKSILESVGASRGVCLTCAAALTLALVRCFAPLSTRVCVP